MGFLKNLGHALMEEMKGIEFVYLGGHPQLGGPQKVKVDAVNDMFQIRRAGKPILEIPKSDIINVSLDKASKRSLGKAAAGAIIGGVLTGGIGAIAGAAIGGRKKDDSIIVLTVKYSSATVDLLFGGDDVSKKYGLFASLLR